VVAGFAQFLRYISTEFIYFRINCSLICFFKFTEKEGKAVNLSYQDKLKLVAFTQQVTHGKLEAEKQPPLGVLDVIGRDRR